MKNKKIIGFALVAVLSIVVVVFTLLPENNPEDGFQNSPENTETEANEPDNDTNSEDNNKSAMDKLEEAIRRALSK